MPIYEYLCEICDVKEEAYRRLDDREMGMLCPKGHAMARVYSVPTLSIWDSERAFPNAVKFGEGKFGSRREYESHLKANDMAESGTSGKIYRPHGNKVVRHGNRKTESTRHARVRASR